MAYILRFLPVMAVMILTVSGRKKRPPEMAAWWFVVGFEVGTKLD